MAIRIGVDTGGTFTDVVLYDESTQNIEVMKTPSTPSNFADGVLTGIDEILTRTATDGPDVSFLSHGTTVGTNAVLEGEIPDIGLITNEGLRDVLEIGDQTRPELYNLQTDKPPHLIPRHLRKEVPGRIDANGDEIDPLDESQTKQVIAELADADVESIVVSMVFSYLNSRHEERIGRLIEEHTDSKYALSSSVHPEIREYDRTITTVLNEAIKRRIQEYLERLEEGTKQHGIEAPLNVMHSGGGVFSTEQATQRAIRTVLSGPAAGAVAAKDISRKEGFTDAIGIDMGGTSADVSIIRDGEIIRSTEGEINDLPIKTPMIDINTVGAGGGSITWIDEGGALRVGPESAGADPGPICYGKGGTRPTVTDANLLLGRINPDAFLDGEMDLVVDRTRELFCEHIATPLGKSVKEAALSVIKVANASLAREIRRVTVERGSDPSDFSLVAFGGAGPLQAPAVAQQMNMDTTIIPQNPGVFSARGLLQADIRINETHSYRGSDIDPETLNDQFEDLEASVNERFSEQGFDKSETTVDRIADIRYQGQAYEISVSVTDGTLDAKVQDAIQAFHDEHERMYGHAMEDEPVEIVTLRVNGRVPTQEVTDTVVSTCGDAYRETRDVYFANVGSCPTDVYWRPAFEPRETVDGPAILEEPGSTAIIPRGTVGRVSEHGSIIVTL